MSEAKVGFFRSDEFSRVLPHKYDANSRVTIAVSYPPIIVKTEIDVPEQDSVLDDETELTNDTVLEFDTPTPIE